MRLCAVFQQVDARIRGETSQLIDRSYLPIEVHQQDGPRPWPETTTDAGGIQHRGDGVDVGKHWRRARPQDGKNRRESRHRRGDDLVARADAHRPQADINGIEAIAAADDMGNAGNARPLPLKRCHFLPKDPPSGPQDTLAGFQLRPDQRFRFGREAVHPD